MFLAPSPLPSVSSPNASPTPPLKHVFIGSNFRREENDLRKRPHPYSWFLRYGGKRLRCMYRRQRRSLRIFRASLLVRSVSMQNPFIAPRRIAPAQRHPIRSRTNVQGKMTVRPPTSVNPNRAKDFPIEQDNTYHHSPFPLAKTLDQRTDHGESDYLPSGTSTLGPNNTSPYVGSGRVEVRWAWRSRADHIYDVSMGALLSVDLALCAYSDSIRWFFCTLEYYTPHGHTCAHRGLVQLGMLSFSAPRSIVG